MDDVVDVVHLLTGHGFGCCVQVVVAPFALIPSAAGTSPSQHAPYTERSCLRTWAPDRSLKLRPLYFLLAARTAHATSATQRGSLNRRRLGLWESLRQLRSIRQPPATSVPEITRTNKPTTLRPREWTANRQETLFLRTSAWLSWATALIVWRRSVGDREGLGANPRPDEFLNSPLALL